MAEAEERKETGVLAELRRRKVFRVAAGYAVTGWIVIEVGSVILPALQAPDWVVTVIVLAVLAGFPLAVLLSWLFDLTPAGLERTSALAGPRRGRLRAAVVVLGALVVSAAGWLAWDRGLLGEQERSIAVLPFDDLSEGGDNEYFSDGVAEELLNSLVGVEGLRVAARTSSWVFRGRKLDAREIGRQLNVGTVLDGSVRRSGDRVRVTATLIDADDGFEIWTNVYDRKLDDIFEIQAEIAGAIAQELRLELFGPLKGAPRAAMSTDFRAYDLYLLGRHHWHQRTRDSLARAAGLFQQAVEIDPRFALAYTGLADTWLLMDGYGDLDTEESTRRAEGPVARALELNGRLPEAYASLGLLRFNQGDLPAAEMALRGAIELNPDYSMAHMWLGLVLGMTEGPRAALESFETARTLDRLHPVVLRNHAGSLAKLGRYDDAVAEMEAAAGTPMADDAFYKDLAGVHMMYGHYPEAVNALGRISATGPGREMSLLRLAEIFAAVGAYDEASGLAAQQARSADPEIAEAAGRVLMSVALARDDRESLHREAARALAAIGDAEQLPREQRARLIWPAVSAFVTGDTRQGIALLERALATEDGRAQIYEPDDEVVLLGLLAWFQRAVGDAGVSATVARARDTLTASRLGGWNTPELAAAEAFLALVTGDTIRARERFETALATGWMMSWLVEGHPASRNLAGSGALAGVGERVEQTSAHLRSVTLAAAAAAFPEAVEAMMARADRTVSTAGATH